MDLYSLKYKILRQISKILWRRNNGVYVCNEDWDNLIILDACRYDIFKEAYNKGYIRGKLEYKISRGTCTPDFLKENFEGRVCKDIIYITGNPYVNQFLEGIFYKIIPVWKNRWSEKYNTVLPKDMYFASLEVARRYPNKKLIIHFMQPHYPFLTDPLGDTGIKYLRESLLGKDEANKEVTVWSIVEREKIDRTRVWRAYKDNLYIALPYVNRLLKILKGKNIVTADHGNVLGEVFMPILPFKIYGHPCEYRMKNLITVPWLVYDNSKITIQEMRSAIEKEIISMKIRKLKDVSESDKHK